MKSNLKTATILAALCALTGVVGCHRSTPDTNADLSSNATARKPPSGPAPITEAELRQIHPNEAGDIPIVMYHGLGAKEKDTVRTIANFKGDLDRMVRLGYCPIRMEEYLKNRIDVPLGKSPILLTFDDAVLSQFKYRSDGTIDPDCVVGILQDFHKAHPDFPLKAVFYILPNRSFDQPAYKTQKLQALLAMGFELGNHTMTHRSLKRLSDAEVKKELALCVAATRQMAPEAGMDTLALPYGDLPRKNAAKNRALLASGEYQGQKYTNRAVLLAGWSPAHAPVAPKCDRMRLPRIKPLKVLNGLDYWLDDLKNHPEKRYISDGDPNTITIPSIDIGQVDKEKLQGAFLRIYDPATGAPVVPKPTATSTPDKPASDKKRVSTAAKPAKG